MTDCFKPWEDNMALCQAALDGMRIPGEPTSDNENMRTHVCSTPECQVLIIIYKNLVAKGTCARAINETKTFPKGLHTTNYCPTTPPPTTMLPTTMLPTPTTTTVSTMPPIDPTVTQAPQVAPTTAASTENDHNTTALAAMVGSGLVFVLILVIVVMCIRRKRTHLSDQEVRVPADDRFAYAELSNTRTEVDTLTGSDMFRGGLALAAVRIHFKSLHFGEVLSQGGFGEVVRALYNGKLVAVKRLLAARRKDPQSIRSFFKEVELTATLEHECIVRFIGVSWDIPANLCMVSEFMVGGDLRSLLTSYSQNGNPNGHDDSKLKMAVQVAHALTYLHTLSTPVVHRDLKSRNILLSSTGDAKLIDFGISCERQDVTMTAGVGTSLWMAPEVMLGQRYDEKADVFAFGVILSELDTHELPYDHARDSVSGQPISNMVLLQQISTGKLKPRFTPTADPDMMALAKDCLEVDPTKRPLAAQVLYRIHQSRQHDRNLAAQTRAAINRSLMTVENSSRGRVACASSP